jgi:hypothetical protein
MGLVTTTDFPDATGMFVMVFVGLVSLGFLLGVSIGRRWALVVLPLLLAAVVMLTRTMEFVASLPLLLVYVGASLGGAWSGLAIRRGLRHPSSS